MIHMAVNCFDNEPTWKIDEGVMGMSYSRFDIPYPSEYRICPFSRMARAAPGVLPLKCEKTCVISDRQVSSRQRPELCAVIGPVENASMFEKKIRQKPTFLQFIMASVEILAL
jgi:hypothetical protein